MSILDKFRALEASFWAKFDQINREMFNKCILYMQDQIVGVFDSKEKVFGFIRRMLSKNDEFRDEVALCVEMKNTPRFYRIILDSVIIQERDVGT